MFYLCVRSPDLPFFSLFNTFFHHFSSLLFIHIRNDITNKEIKTLRGYVRSNRVPNNGDSSIRTDPAFV